jgi:hypothetical protein
MGGAEESREARGLGAGSLARSVPLVAIAFLLVSLVPQFVVAASTIPGHDYVIYMEATREWLGGGSFYEAEQVAGPYAVVEREILYPPYVLPLLAVFSLLPTILWWIVPVAIICGVVAWHRPAAWGWSSSSAC